MNSKLDIALAVDLLPLSLADRQKVIEQLSAIDVGKLLGQVCSLRFEDAILADVLGASEGAPDPEDTMTTYYLQVFAAHHSTPTQLALPREFQASSFDPETGTYGPMKKYNIDVMRRNASRHVTKRIAAETGEHYKAIMDRLMAEKCIG